jgi:hypothetical protein
MNGGTTPRRIPIRAALIRAALLGLGATLLLAGCGSSSSSSASSSGNAATTASASAASTTSASAAMSAFTTCLKQHGVKVSQHFGARPHGSFSPGAVPSGSPRPRASFFAGGQNSAAFKACAKYAPAGGFHRVISSSALAAFKSCLSSNGVKITGTTASAILSELRNATGKTAAAVRTCRVLLQPNAAPTPSS